MDILPFDQLGQLIAANPLLGFAALVILLVIIFLAWIMRLALKIQDKSTDATIRSTVALKDMKNALEDMKDALEDMKNAIKENTDATEQFRDTMEQVMETLPNFNKLANNNNMTGILMKMEDGQE